MVKKIFDISPPKELKKEKYKEISFEEKPHLDISPSKRLPFKKALILILLVLIIIIGAVHFSFSQVEVEIWPETEIVKFETKLRVEKGLNRINFADKIIPGVIFEEEKTFSEEFSATGKKLLEKKAEGIVRIFNDSQKDQVLIAQTRLQAPLEKFQPSLEKGENPWFRTTERVLIPAKSYKDVKVVADAPGEKYNIEPSTFSIPGLAGTAQYTFVYGKSFEPMKGGMKGERLEVSQEDLKKAEEILKEKTNREMKDVLKNKIPAEFIVIEEAFKTEILGTSSLAQPGAELEKFSFQIKAKTKTLSFKKEDLENFSKEFIISQISSDKKIDQKSLNIKYSSENIDLEKGKIVLSLGLEAKIYSDINEDSLKRALVSKSLTEIQFFLQNQPGIKQTKVRLWPFWIKKVPDDLEKIKIKLNLD